VKFLLDQNLSARLVEELQADYPGTGHVREFGLDRASDEALWEFAKEKGFVLLSKDADFHQLSFLHGHPPKVVWANLGNCSTDQILETLRMRRDDIAQFHQDEEASFLRLS